MIVAIRPLILFSLTQVRMAAATCAKLKGLRVLLKDHGLNGYTMRTGDYHNSEFLADRDRRIAYISGFTGSNGTIAVTEDKALLWTDGRYFEQASKQLGAEWTLMKDNIPGVLPISKWLAQLPSDSKIGFDPRLMTISEQESFKQAKVNIVPVDQNLIDELWDKDTNEMADQTNTRTHQSRLTEHSRSVRSCFRCLSKSGLSCAEKLNEVRKNILKGETLVVTALDEIAWVLNLRASDIPYTPVFFAFLVIDPEHACLYVDGQKIDDYVNAHLSESGVDILDYESFWSDIKKLSSEKAVVSKSTSVAIRSALGAKCVLFNYTPIAKLKAAKNEVEQNGFKQCHIRDAVAVCEFLFELSKHPENYDELSAEKLLDSLRAKQDGYISLSFRTISGYGPNGAVIHYNASEQTNLPLGRSSLYLVDSGGQYDDGTTDITRTVHFGTPTAYEKKCFTAVLKGHLALADANFPSNTGAGRLDSIARMQMWNMGMDYEHGTGHGVGYCLGVHEGPFSISTRISNDEPLCVGAVVSNEPGYYESGAFGIRIENLLLCQVSKLRESYLSFKNLTMVPICKNLVDVNLLTQAEICAYNQYHSLVRETIVPELKRQNKENALIDWVIEETTPI